MFDIVNGSRIKKHVLKEELVQLYAISLINFFKNAFINFNDTKPRDATFCYIEWRAYSLKPCISPIYLQPFATYALPMYRYKYVLSWD